MNKSYVGGLGGVPRQPGGADTREGRGEEEVREASFGRLFVLLCIRSDLDAIIRIRVRMRLGR